MGGLFDNSRDRWSAKALFSRVPTRHQQRCVARFAERFTRATHAQAELSHSRLRELSENRWVFTEEELAGLLGRTNRQAVDGHMKGFRETEGDLLDFLKHTRTVDDDVVELVWQVCCSDPYAGLSSMAEQANASYTGKKPLHDSNIREALSQIGGDTVWREMLKGLENG